MLFHDLKKNPKPKAREQARLKQLLSRAKNGAIAIYLSSLSVFGSALNTSGSVLAGLNHTVLFAEVLWGCLSKAALTSSLYVLCLLLRARGKFCTGFILSSKSIITLLLYMQGTVIFLEISSLQMCQYFLTSQCALGNALNLSLLWRCSTVYFATFKAVCGKLAAYLGNHTGPPGKTPVKNDPSSNATQDKCSLCHISVLSICAYLCSSCSCSIFVGMC